MLETAIEVAPQDRPPTASQRLRAPEFRRVLRRRPASSYLCAAVVTRRPFRASRSRTLTVWA
jgi:hypothetical protein